MLYSTARFRIQVEQLYESVSNGFGLEPHSTDFPTLPDIGAQELEHPGVLKSFLGEQPRYVHINKQNADSKRFLIRIRTPIFNVIRRRSRISELILSQQVLVWPKNNMDPRNPPH